jgi:hypothetical protein
MRTIQSEKIIDYTIQRTYGSSDIVFLTCAIFRGITSSGCVISPYDINAELTRQAVSFPHMHMTSTPTQNLE